MEIHVDFKIPGHTNVNTDKQKLATPVKIQFKWADLAS